MCGLIGYACDAPKSHHAELLKSLFYESRIRGLHAFGFAHWDGRKIATQRFLSLGECLDAIPALATRLIGHCRYSTSGDYQTLKNNQPLQIGDTALAFNGVISMATKREYEQEYGRRYETENDGEIFLDKFIRGEDWQSFVAGSRLSFAGLVLDNARMIAVRNRSRPLHTVTKEDATFFASTADIFKRAGFTEKPNEVPPGEAVFAR